MNFNGDDIVKSCRKLESGLRLGVEGIHACQLGQFSSPLFWASLDADELVGLTITKEMIIEKRRHIFDMLNDDHSDTPCKHCNMVIEKRFKDVDFTRLGHIDLAHTTICNLRCNYCGYTDHTERTGQNIFLKSKYDALAILRLFSADDVEWDAAVDFNGGEPSLLADFEEFIEYFVSRRIRIFLYTNAVEFRQAIYDGLADGTIRWVCTSLDVGTPSSFFRIKQRDVFPRVLENLARYARAGSMGGGKVAVKYIFTADNCGDDDLYGFTYAMLALRPQSVWLTFDFEPLHTRQLPGDSDDFGGYDYSRHIAAYAKMYLLLKMHGLVAEHFAQRHLAVVTRQGKALLERAADKIKEREREAVCTNPQQLVLGDFRQVTADTRPTPFASFYQAPLLLRRSGGRPEAWRLQTSRVVIAPACAASMALLRDSEIRSGNIVGFLDRDQVLHGKLIEGIPIFPYEALQELRPDVVLVTAPEIHLNSILCTVSAFAGEDVCVAVLDNAGENP